MCIRDSSQGVDLQLSSFQKSTILTVRDDATGEAVTRVVKIPALPISFERNSDLSALSWDALDDRLPLDEIRRRYGELIDKPRIDPIFVLVTVGLANASFCRLFGGDWTAAGIVFTATLVGFAARQRMQAHGVNHFLIFIISAFMASLCASAALRFDWRAALEKDTLSMAADILHALLPDFQDMDRLVRDSYAGKFPTSDLTPLTPVADKYVLELYHGPTSAFKDVALSVLPRLIVAAAKAEGMKGDVVILTATSGDTGKAAMEGFHDVPGTRITVFYPYGGVSAVQQAQMATQEGANVRVCAVRGNFDDAQTGVKEIFAACKDKDLHGAMLSSANSINIGRLAPQVVYYFRAYGDLVKSGRIRLGDVVDYTVPTGNFGDILAADYAGKAGLPVGRLICASNENNVLTDFINTGVYDVENRPFYKTITPSMDILVSSNLERLLFDLSGCDGARVARFMGDLAGRKRYAIDEAMKAALQKRYFAGCVDEAGVRAEIRRTWEEDRYLMDTHTAVASAVLRAYQKETGDARRANLFGQQMRQFVPAIAALIAAIHDERRGFALHKITVALLGARLARQI